MAPDIKNVEIVCSFLLSIFSDHFSNHKEKQSDNLGV